MIPLIPSEFQKAVLAWYREHGRHALPWQNVSTPYTVWLSETMLQQTQVATVIPYFLRFLERFPSVRDLAEAEEPEVMKYWAGLGYYARARNLHRAAQQLCERFDGQFPDTFEDIISLPGIGRSTAGAILAFSFQKPYPILDGNVRRVLSRYHGVDGWSGVPAVSERLWSLATEYTPTSSDVSEYTQAMMDLGAMLCTRTKPDCERCPVHSSCYAAQGGLTARYPSPKPKKERPVREAWFLWLTHEAEWAMERRVSETLWRGLYAPLWFDSESALGAYLEAYLPDHAYVVHEEGRHVFTHFELVYIPVTLKLVDKGLMSDSRWIWTAEPLSLALPAPVEKWLRVTLV